MRTKRIKSASAPSSKEDIFVVPTTNSLVEFLRGEDSAVVLSRLSPSCCKKIMDDIVQMKQANSFENEGKFGAAAEIYHKLGMREDFYRCQEAEETLEW